MPTTPHDEGSCSLPTIRRGKPIFFLKSFSCKDHTSIHRAPIKEKEKRKFSIEKTLFLYF